MPPAALAVAAFATAAVGTGYSIYAGERANKQNKKATKLQRQQASLQDARQKRDAIRQSRLAYAQAQANAENQGVATSSAAQGGQGSIVSQLNDNLSFLDQYGFLTDQAQKSLGKAQSWEASSRLGAAISDLGMSVFSNAPNISKVFKSG